MCPGSGARIFGKGGLLILIVITSLLLPSLADAHKVSVYAYAEDGKIYAEGYFVDGSRAKNSLIEVLDGRSGEKLFEVRTDENGEASFDIPRIAPLRLVITAGMGHKNDYTLDEEELRQGSGAVEQGTGRRELSVKSQESRGRSEELRVKSYELRDKELEAVVERVVERKLQPIKNILIKIKEDSSKPGITEILGGIGYILGLMGIYMYFKCRR
jgi:nickel transport protein